MGEKDIGLTSVEIMVADATEAREGTQIVEEGMVVLLFLISLFT